MAKFWERVTRLFTSVDKVRRDRSRPNTYYALPPAADAPEIFDPALSQFPRAFRRGELRLVDPETHRRWYDARLRAIHHLLRLIATSHWSDQLVLRGSFLLKHWIGDEAREPGDIDWVVVPASIALADPWIKQMVEGLKLLVFQQPQCGDVRLHMDRLEIDDIWTYERVPGRRIVVPWTTPDLPPGYIQMDFVFGEELWQPPEILEIDLEGEPILLQAATPELSLAWKLYWIDSDMHPQGKDLYDAVLLAERTPLSVDLLRRALAEDTLHNSRELPRSLPRWQVDWPNFQKEYPQITGTGEQWLARLRHALQPTFDQLRPQG